MNLATTYALHAGLTLDKPILFEDYVPLAADSYITFHMGGGQKVNEHPTNFPSKIYAYWSFVIQLLKEAGLKEKIVQIGETHEPLMPGVDIDKRGQTNFRQVFYLVKRAAAHMGNCSFPGHVAGAYDVPEVILYGPTAKFAHSPHWRNSKSIFLESDRDGKKCTFSAMEDPRTIDRIKPEEVANAVLSILGYPPTTLKTVHLGKLASQMVVEYVPNFPLNGGAIPGLIPSIRLDYHFNEDNAYQFISQRKAAIITDKELNLTVLKQLKPNIAIIHYEVKNTSVKYLNELKKVGLPIRFFSRLKDKELAELRLEYFDIGNIFEQRENETKVEGAIMLRTNKVLLSQGKMYASRAHEREKIELDARNNSCKIVDDPAFWENLEFMWLYNQ